MARGADRRRARGLEGFPRDPVPSQLADEAAVLEGAEVRFWGDRAPENIDALAAEK